MNYITLIVIVGDSMEKVKVDKGKIIQRTVLIVAIACIPVLFWVWYHAVTPQDRYFIGLEGTDIGHIFIYNDRTGRSEIELEGDDRRTVTEQLLTVTLKGGWRTEGMGGMGKMYHIVLEDGREFDFGVTLFMEQEEDGMFRSNPYFVVDGLRMYHVAEKDEELSGQMIACYVEIMNRLYPVS